MSGFLATGWLYTRIGYGLYFTTSRLFGVNPGAHGGSELAGTLAGYIEGQLMPTLAPKDNAEVIDELDRVKDFQLAKDQIRRIELKKPGLFGLGRMNVVPVTQRSISIQLRHPIAYDRLFQLTQAFGPELLNR